MVLDSNSILRYLPKELDKRILLILDSLRFTIDMIDLSWESLNSLLLKISSTEIKAELPKVFLNTWSIIDNVQRFINLYELIPSDSGGKILDSLRHVKPTRNTFAHLDERIDSPLLKTNTPFYGTLTWGYKNVKSRKVESFSAITGIIQYGHKNSFKIGEYDQTDQLISNIILETVDRNDKISVNLNELIYSLTDIIRSLENNLDRQIKNKGLNRADWIHIRDILLIMKNN